MSARPDSRDGDEEENGWGLIAQGDKLGAAKCAADGGRVCSGSAPEAGKDGLYCFYPLKRRRNAEAHPRAHRRSYQ